MPKRRRISTARDYRNSLNKHILPRFGNTPIDDININDVEDFIDDLELDLSSKRVNNILVPQVDHEMGSQKGNRCKKHIATDKQSAS